MHPRTLRSGWLARLPFVLSGPILIAGLGLILSGCAREPEAHWYRGNTHTHSLWSDGDLAPEAIVARYREAGYHFLVLSDHDRFQTGERWYPVRAEGQGDLTQTRVRGLMEQFGDTGVVTRGREGRVEMRLKTFTELQTAFEESGRFLLVPGHELSDGAEGRPLHFNVLNTEEVLPQARGTTMETTLLADVAAFRALQERTAHPLVLHLNHPNWHWAQDAADLARSPDLRFFEVFNASTGCNNDGDADHPSTDVLWDRAQVVRLEAGMPLLYGLASDDAHDYFRTGPDVSAPFRGWVVVRAPELTPDALMRAMDAGDFYASTGVGLTDLRVDGRSYRVDIDAVPEVTYTTRFIGVRRSSQGDPGEAEVLLETTADPAVYRVSGDRLIVRAKIVSSEPEPDPAVMGARQRAWTQPVVPPGR